MAKKALKTEVRPIIPAAPEFVEEVTIEADIHITKVVPLPRGVKAEEQLTYDKFDETKGKIKRSALYSLMQTLAPIASSYDDFGVKNYQLFITTKEEGSSERCGEEETSEGNVPE